LAAEPCSLVWKLFVLTAMVMSAARPGRRLPGLARDNQRLKLTEGNEWVQGARDFDEFAAMLGLEQRHTVPGGAAASGA
jgi:hypothetical protein